MDNTDNKGDVIKKQYSIQPYAHPEFPTSEIRYQDNGSGENIHLRDYLSVILKRKWIIIAFFICVVVTTTILSFLMVPVYQSTITIKIDKQNPDALSVPGLEFSRPGTDYYTTQYELLKSRSLAEKVIKKLALDKNSNFLPVQSIFSKATDLILVPIKNFASYFASLFTSEEDKPASGSTRKKEEIPVYLSNALISRLEVTPVKDSQLVKVTFESNDPEISMLVTNAIADAYIEYDLESRIDASRAG